MASRITTMFAAAGLAVVLPFGASAAAAAATAAGTSARSSASGAADRSVVSFPAVSSAPFAADAAPAAGGTSTFGIQPVPHSNSDTRSAFAVSATPGARSKDAVRVSNFGDQALTLHLYAADAVNTEEGGYDLKASGVRSVDVGTWVTFDGVQPYITIPAKTFVDVPFTLSVPINATPGDHPGGIVVGLTTPSLDSHGNRITIEQRVGTRVYLRVAGALRAQLSVQQLGAVYHNNWNPFGDGSATVTYQVKNTGNVRLSAKQAVHITSMLGGSVQAGALKDMEQLLPGNSLKVTTTVQGITPSFVSTAHVSVDPAPVPGDLDPQVAAVQASATMATVPWIWMIVLALLGGLGFEVFRQRRKAGRPGAPAVAAVAAGSGVKAGAGQGSKPAAKAGAKAAADQGAKSGETPVSAEQNGEAVPAAVPAGAVPAPASAASATSASASSEPGN